MVFANREDAGKLLARRIASYRGNTDSVVIGLTRGGVAVAKTLASELKLPLAALVVKKIGSPIDPELAIGAVAPDSISDIDWDLARRVGADEDFVTAARKRLEPEIAATSELFRLPGRKFSLTGKTVILTDDGIATGATVRAAIKWLRVKNVHDIILAVPVMPQSEVGPMELLADTLVVLEAPKEFESVGSFYRDFSQIGNDKVLQLLRIGKERKS